MSDDRPDDRQAGRLTVSLATYGGLAAGVNLARGARVVDTGLLTAADAAHLHRLLRAVQVEPPATEARAEPDAGAHQEAGAQRGPGADVVGYTVTVGTDGDARTVLRATDLTMSDAFADLVDWIEEHATGA